MNLLINPNFSLGTSVIFRLALILFFLALAGDAVQAKPSPAYLPIITNHDPLCGYSEKLDRWWCYKETQ